MDTACTIHDSSDSSTLQDPTTDDLLTTVLKPPISNRYQHQLLVDADGASETLRAFISEANQSDVLDFAFKAKVLHQGQCIGQGINDVKSTLADIESAEASTASQLSSLTAYEQSAQERLSSRLEDIGSTVRETSGDVKTFQSTMAEFGAAISKIELLESNLATSVSEKLGPRLETFVADARAPDKRLSDELVVHLKETYNKLSSFSESMVSMRAKTSLLSSRLETLLETIPTELQSLRNTLKETSTLNLPMETYGAGHKDTQELPNLPPAPRQTRQYEEWRDYYANFARMYRRTSLTDLEFIWLFLDHISNDELALQIQRNMCTANSTKDYVKLRRQPKGRRRINISPKLSWEAVKTVVKCARPPFPKFVQ